jgi:hypothetical protein
MIRPKDTSEPPPLCLMRRQVGWEGLPIDILEHKDFRIGLTQILRR